VLVGAKALKGSYADELLRDLCHWGGECPPKALGRGGVHSSCSS